MKPLRVATRNSPLALWQANHVAQLLRARRPGLEVSLVGLVTEGDRFLSAPLAQAGGKGLFVKEIEQALLEGRAEVAVHSLKDVTSEIPEALLLAAVLEREDPRDAFIGVRCTRVEDVPPGGRVGTSSLRRTSQLRARQPGLEIISLRGNVQSRLRKTREQGLWGTVLAMAGLKRLGLGGEATQIFEPEVILPAVGQGVLAIECGKAEGEVKALVESLDHPTTRCEVTAERAFLARLEGGCSVPLAAYAVARGPTLWLRGMIGRPDGQRIVRGERLGPRENASSLGQELAEELLSLGGEEILRDFKANLGARP